MNTHEIGRALARLASALPGTKSSNPRAALYKVSDYLSTLADIPLAEHILGVEAARPPKANARSNATKKAPPVPNEAIVQKYVMELRSAETISADDFSRVLKALTDDKKVRIVELKQICEQYTGDPSALSSKPAGYGRISQTFDYRWKLANRS